MLACREDLDKRSASGVDGVTATAYEQELVADILDTVDHPNQERYPGQQIHVIAIEEHVSVVPFVESEEEVFLETIIPSRKATKSYRGEGA